MKFTSLFVIYSGLKQRLIVCCVLAVRWWLLSNVATGILICTYKFRTAIITLPPLRIFGSRKPWHPFAEIAFNTKHLNGACVAEAHSSATAERETKNVYGWIFIFSSVRQTFCPHICNYLGTAVAQWLRCCATNQKVNGSIPPGVNGIFHWHKILLISLWTWSRLSL